MRLAHWIPLATAISFSTGIVACDDESKTAAPKSSALAPVKKPTAVTSHEFEVAKDSAKVTFLMDAPIEKIYGDAPKSVEGSFFADVKDIEKSKGLLKIDLDKLVIYQDKRESEKDDFSGKKVKNDTQNKHMRVWLEISEDAPKETREKNRYIEFKIKKVTAVGDKDLSAMKGAERKVKLKLTGDFRLHERTVEKTAEVEATFKYDGDKPTSVSIKSLKPIAVSIEKDHDVRPRKAFGKIVDWSSGVLTKVNKVPMVTIEFDAKVKTK